jgi:hypothetical protein
MPLLLMEVPLQAGAFSRKHSPKGLWNSGTFSFRPAPAPPTAPSLSQFPGGLGPEATPMSTRFFTNHGEHTLLRKFQGVFESNTDIEWFDALVGYVEGIANFVARSGQVLPASQFGKGKPRLTAPGKADVRGKMEARGPRLKEFVSGQIGWGVKTGLNEAFVIDRTTRDNLISESARSTEVIKPLLVGDDVRRYERHFRESYLIYMRHGVSIRDYPAIERHLKPFKARLENRATEQGWYELQQPQEAYVPLFEAPKTIYPDIGKVTRFAIDEDNYYGSNTTYFIARADWYLLGVLNSAASFDYLRGTCAALGDEQDGGRLRFFGQYLETLPIPSAPDSERATIAKLAKEAQRLHGHRRARVERFLCEVGLEPAQSTSRNPLEQPWSLPPEEFTRRAPRPDVKQFTPTRDETAALTEKIQTVEREIDQRVAALYGL